VLKVVRDLNKSHKREYGELLLEPALSRSTKDSKLVHVVSNSLAVTTDARSQQASVNSVTSSVTRLVLDNASLGVPPMHKLQQSLSLH